MHGIGRALVVVGWCIAAADALLPTAAVASRRPGRGPLTCELGGGSPVRREALDARVRTALARERWPFVVPAPRAGIELSEDVVFSDGLQSLRGREQYLAASAAFQRQLREEAAGAAVSLVRVAQLDPETVSVRYNVSWVPPNAAWLETLGRAVPGWRVVKVATLCAQREIMCIEIG